MRSPEIRFSLNSLLLYSCCKSMPFCLENYVPLFKGLVDYFAFLKRRLEFTRAYAGPHPLRREPSYMIESSGLPPIVYEFESQATQKPRAQAEPRVAHSKTLRKTRYLNRGGLGSAYGGSGRSTRTHLLLKHERYQDAHKTDSVVIKKLTAEQKKQLRLHEEYVRREEEKELRLVDGAAVTQVKLIMTIIRNLVASSFNEKIVYNEKKLLNVLYDILFYNNDSELDKLALENFAVISRWADQEHNSLGAAAGAARAAAGEDHRRAERGLLGNLRPGHREPAQPDAQPGKRGFPGDAAAEVHPDSGQVPDEQQQLGGGARAGDYLPLFGHEDQHARALREAALLFFAAARWADQR